MHCSLWRFDGDPDELERRYVALAAEVPIENQVLHAAAKTPDGLLIFDTCPSKEVFDDFYSRPEVKALFARHGLEGGTCEDYPVIRGFARGQRVDAPGT